MTNKHLIVLIAVIDALGDTIHLTDSAEAAMLTLKANPGAWVDLEEIEVDDQGMPV